MKRRTFLQSLAAGAAALPVVTSAQSAPASSSTGTTTPPVLAGPSPDSINVLWGVAGFSRGYVEYGESASLGMRAEGEMGPGFIARGDRVLRVRLTGLKPGVTYHALAVTVPLTWGGGYKTTGEIRSSPFTFRLPDANATSTHLAIWNDTHDRAPVLKALHQQTMADRPELLIWNGDICNDLYNEAHLPGLYLGPGGGLDLSQIAPLCLVRGNHDVRGAYAHRLIDYSATPDGLPYYALRVGPVALAFMDTGEDKADDHPSFGGLVAFDALRRKQAEWLEELRARPLFRDAPYRIMCCHLPMRWTDEKTVHSYDHWSERSRRYWHDGLVKWGTQVVISGHTHRYAWIPATKEFPYAQFTGGGPSAETATLLRIRADATHLAIDCSGLDGRTIRRERFSPLA